LMHIRPSITRREFLIGTAATALLSGCSSGPKPALQHIEHPIAIEDYPRDLKITRVLAFNLPCPRRKFIGRNARRKNHGDTATEKLVRVYTNTGIEAIGHSQAPRENWAQLLGKNPFHFYHRQRNGFITPVGVDTMALWDLAGKMLNKPVYKFLGTKGARLIPIYDGSIYFSEMVSLFARQGLDRFRQEIDQGLKYGHRAFKIKIGRGYQWMDKKAGYQMDVTVLKTIRRHTGPQIKLGVDANNGYDFQQTKQLLNDLPDFNFEFMEEMFPESIEQYRNLRHFMAKHKYRALIADGETQARPENLKPFIDAKVIDIFQGDMRGFGFEGIMTEAQWCQAAGSRVAPHNWGSMTGFYAQLHVGRAITNFYMAENDPLTSEVLIADGFNIKDGRCSVPQTPGLGLKINPVKFADRIKVRFDIKL
ncbi:MAG: enolase C-terminal domain-like protein, partial [Planctomycetota bacterium]